MDTKFEPEECLQALLLKNLGVFLTKTEPNKCCRMETSLSCTWFDIVHHKYFAYEQQVGKSKPELKINL